MTIYRWKNTKPVIGMTVQIPTTTEGHNKPNVGGLSTITYVPPTTEPNGLTLSGQPYVWITLFGDDGVWGSHRLGFVLVEEVQETSKNN